MRATSWAAFAALLIACWAPSRPTAPRRDAPITLPVEQLELPNGLRVVVVPESLVGEVSITMRYAVGSSDDPAGRAGLAHVVEHLMFEHVRGDEALFDFLERRALAFNGLTTPDATIYSERGTVAELEELLEVEAARLLGSCSSIPASAFARQREIVRNELRERAPGERVQAVLHEALFATARESSTADSVAAITQEDACRFAAAHYAANNAVLVISGAVRASDIRPLLDRTLGRVPRVATHERSRAGEPTRTARRTVTLEAPLDRTWFLLAWPLPPDLAGRTRLRAVAAMATSLVSADVNGLVTSLELGTGAARYIAVAVAPSKDITVADALDSTKNALARIGPWFGSGLYEHAKNRAIHRFAASLDHSGDRDLMLASEAAAAATGATGGPDVRTTLDQALQGLATMSRDEAEQLAHSGLAPARATIVTLRPMNHAPEGSVVTSLAASFDEARRRKLEDPADARRPLDAPMPANPLADATTQTLPNGLRIVLLPLSTMPTVDIRLVLPVGTADEPLAQRGIALVAAHALHAPFDATMFQFLQGGGRVDEDVGFDQTVFSTRGLASRIDLLLAGLATTIREGTYDLEGVRSTANWLTLTSSSDAGAYVAAGAWREAVYGPEHPYRFASLWQYVQRKALDIDALLSFRAQHYQPGGATLVIAGNFDPVNATRWVEYHFQDWAGTPTTRRARRAEPRALAFAQRADQTQLSIQLAFALPGDDSVAEDLVTEMVSEAIADIREQLAASYGLHAVVVRHRFAPPTLELAGSIDGSRAAEAVGLLRDRLAQLRARDDAAAAGLFVSARRRVVARLSSVDTRADALAERITTALETGEMPSLDLADAECARTITIDRLQPLLDRLDLAQATILVRGPGSAIAAAYGAIGRTPALLH